jgi:cephalosporin-C deacetylase-like acetyl esterase
MQLCFGTKLLAQKGSNDIVVTEQALSKDAIFKADSTIEYEFQMENNYNRVQQGTLGYVIRTPHGDLITQSAVTIRLQANGTQTLYLKLPPQRPGFYKVNFMVNVNDYDDTIRRVFGVGIENIRSEHPKPVDFALFWKNTKAQLALVPPHYIVTERPELVQPDYKVYQVEMKSFGNITIRGWMTMPKDKQPQEKLPVYLVLPGYGAELKPIPGVPHFACLAIDVRGFGNSSDVIQLAENEFITHNIADKNKYILRGAIMDCKRMLDFVMSNKDFDHSAICVTGGSMGGYLSYVLAALDPRVALVIADNPTFSDWRWQVGYGFFPMANVERYAREHKVPMAPLLRTLDYFDLKNFMPMVKAKSIMAIGLLDNFAPPNTELVSYNALTGDKQMFIYSDLGHEVDKSLGEFKGKWLYNNFNMYQRVLDLNKKPGDIAVNAPAAATGITMNNTPINGTPPADETEPAVTNPNTVINAAKLAQQDEGNGSKYDTSPVGIAAHPGSRSSIFKKSTTIYYDVSLKNHLSTAQKGTVTCQVTTKTGDHISVTTAAVKLAPQELQKFRMNLPLQRGGYFKATFILNLTSYRDTIVRDFGVDVDNLGETGGNGLISITEHPGAKNAEFSSKNTIYYTFDLKNDFETQQNGTLACEVRSMDNKFISLTAVAVKLPPKATTTDVRINFYIQKKGQYKANFIIKTPSYRDTLKRTFSVDTNETAQPVAHVSEDQTIDLLEHPGNKDATFKSSSVIFYNIDLKNNFKSQETGKLSCRISTMDDKIVSLTTVDVSLGGKSSKSVHMNLPSQPPGFYKVNFMINVPDYDDTTRRVFGVDITDIHSPTPKPVDFDEFWAATRLELDKVDPHFKMIEKPELSKGNDQVYLIEMQSLGNLTVRAWLTLPKDRKPNQKFPVYLALPGYGADQKPFHDMPDFAAIAVNVRGQGNSNDVLNINREEFLTYNILNKNKYILRGAIMDCIRAVDFICSRPEFDPKMIYSNGGSMGGYLSLITASLDNRISVCTAGNPAFSDWRSLVDHNDFPMGSIQRYARENGLSLNRILDNMDYFDLKNFTGNIKCKTLVGIGLLDNLAPPHTEMAAYNNIQAPKKIFIFPNLGHQVGDTFGNYTGKMVYDNFGIF